MRRPVRLPWVTLAALMLMVLLLCWREATRGRPARASHADEHAPAAAAPGALPPTALTPRAPVPAGDGEAQVDTPAITVEAVVLENRAPCRGEESLVSVVAHAADPADDPWITVEVNGVPGDRVPLRSYGAAEAQGLPVQRSVIVRGRGGVELEMPLPQILVRDCQRPHEVLVAHDVDALSDGRVTFRAVLVDNDHPEAPAPVAAYVWDFDDGSRVETEAPEVVHDYAARRQDAATSSYLVSCTARLAAGGEVVGHDALALANPLFAGDGEVVAIAGDSQEPTPDGRVVVRLRQGSGEPVMLTRLVRRRHAWDRLGVAPAETELQPAAILGSARLGTDGLTLSLTADPSRDVVADEYLLEGATAGGRPARGRFFVRGPGVPSRLLARLDLPVFREKLARARTILGTSRVTEEDVFQLERTHAFDDLEPESP